MSALIDALFFISQPDRGSDRFFEVLTSKFPQRSFGLVKTVDECAEALKEAEVLVTYGPHLTDQLVRGASRLRWLHSLITGVDWLDRLPSLRPEVIVTRTRIYGPPMSEMALLHMFALSRNLPGFFRNQQAHRWQRWPGHLLGGKTVGILGIGAIGEALAPKLKGLGMTVIGISSTAREVAGIDRFVGRDRLVEVAPELDYLVVIVPLSPETRGIVSAEVIGAMKPSAYLINMARGGVVDEEAMMEALRSGSIAGAGLDVFSVEPLPADHPLWDMENVIITPHCGGASVANVDANLAIIEHNLRCYINGNLGDLTDRVR